MERETLGMGDVGEVLGVVSDVDGAIEDVVVMLLDVDEVELVPVAGPPLVRDPTIVPVGVGSVSIIA